MSRRIRIRIVEEEGRLSEDGRIPPRTGEFPKHIRSKSFYPAIPKESDFEFFEELLERLGLIPSRHDAGKGE